MQILKKLIEALIGMLFIGIGLNLELLADFGVGPFDTMTYFLQEFLNITKFGNASLLLHSIFLVMLIIYYIIYRKNLLLLVISFISIFILTRFINLFSFIEFLDVTNFFIKVICFSIGMIILSFGLFITSKTNIVIAPYDKSVVELALFRMKELGRIRIIVDVSLLISAIVLAFIFKIKIPLSLGTIIITFGTGYILSIYDHILNKMIKLIKKGGL